MASVKEIRLKVIDSKTANAFVKKHHYSGKVVSNSQLHFGAFLGGGCMELCLLDPQWTSRKL